MKQFGVVVLALCLLLAACSTSNDQQLVAVSVGLPEQVADPILNAEGNILAGRFTGSEAQIVKLDQGRALPRATLSAEGDISDLQLATRTAGSQRGRTLAVATSCPGGYGDQPVQEEFRTCLSPPAMVSVELDGEGRKVGEQTSLPSGLKEGTLFASESTFVWEGRDRASRAIYTDGRWRKINTEEPATNAVTSRCTTRNHLWVLHGDSGPRTMTGSGSVQPNPNPSFSLFRYVLDGSTDNEWVRAPIAGLERTDFAQLACGVDEAFVRVGDSLYSTASPDKPIGGITAGLDELRGNAAKRPVLFLEDGTCTIVSEGGRLLQGRERQGSATSARASSCDSVPWPRGDGFVGLSQDLVGNIRVMDW
jgi:hypothetical protein